LGTSGSGDVLAGALAGFIARGVLPVDAAQWAIVAHAQAGEELAHDVGRVGFLAREISQSLPAVLDDLARMTAMRNA
jgi:NAD(P)H-hydrate repair Nnr-like enzyme with NAD(P)H-hydrate dehydratase domain